jgi:hypothetical protein
MGFLSVYEVCIRETRGAAAVVGLLIIVIVGLVAVGVVCLVAAVLCLRNPLVWVLVVAMTKSLTCGRLCGEASRALICILIKRL